MATRNLAAKRLNAAEVAMILGTSAAKVLRYARELQSQGRLKRELVSGRRVFTLADLELLRRRHQGTPGHPDLEILIAPLDESFDAFERALENIPGAVRRAGEQALLRRTKQVQEALADLLRHARDVLADLDAVPTAEEVETLATREARLLGALEDLLATRFGQQLAGLSRLLEQGCDATGDEASARRF
jgi:hypothetical protein